jgi:putative ABC transport system permease protein
MLALVSGHYPAGPGQVALTSQVAALYNTHAGGNWRQGSRARRVAGIVENPGNLADEFALITPGQVGAPTEVTVLFDATPASVSAFRFPAGATVQTPPPPGGVSPAFIVLAAATLGLIFVGLVAVASFTVLARRRLRALGMLGSLGAADRNIALVMTANGAIIGTAGAIAGALAGFAAWSGYRPYLETSAGHRIGVLHLPWPVIGTGMVLAVVTSVLASRRPARRPPGCRCTRRWRGVRSRRRRRAAPPCPASSCCSPARPCWCCPAGGGITAEPPRWRRWAA